MKINELTGIVVGLYIKIHTKVGPGCFEKAYEKLLSYELSKLGIEVERRLLLPIAFEGLNMENAYKRDLLVEDRLVI